MILTWVAQTQMSLNLRTNSINKLPLPALVAQTRFSSNFTTDSLRTKAISSWVAQTYVSSKTINSSLMMLHLTRERLVLHYFHDIVFISISICCE